MMRPTLAKFLVMVCSVLLGTSAACIPATTRIETGTTNECPTPNILAGMNRLLLNDAKWTCRLLRADPSAPAGFPSTPFPASIPGCIHTDLIQAGLIGHPNIADNESRTQWIGLSDWQYQCKLEVDAELLKQERIDLVFSALDTLATIRLNGTVIGRAANQFHPHRFDVRNVIRAGSNELTVDFKSPVEHIRAESMRLGARPVNGDWDPYVFIRKSACNFGWDWGPKVATVGITGAVCIEAWNVARIENVRPLISREPDGSWLVDAHIRIDRSEASDSVAAGTPPRLTLLVRIHDGEKSLSEKSVEVAGAATDVTIQLTTRDVTPWMPRGYGEPARYSLTVELRRSLDNSSLLDRSKQGIGFRTIALDTAPDELGDQFTIRVNDKPIFVKGANWIPEGLFPKDRNPGRIRERIQQAADANLNLLRVWGGGKYESDFFYRTCDQLGILVWQDFMFACACYPEEQPIRSEVETEARYQIARLSSHPSVALWCGGNECIWAWQGWGFASKLKSGQTWGRGYWLDLLPRLCAELDPTRPYWPNTPWSGSLDRDVQDPNYGTRHTWDKQVEGYRDLVPRFIAEFGHQSPPNYATIRESLIASQSPDRKGGVSAPNDGRFDPADNLDIHLASAAQMEAMLRTRQRASGGDAERYDKPLAEHFAPARDFDEWLYQAHVLQARAISIGIEWARIHPDRCGGAIFWQLNDAWAGHSWSAIDVAGRLKPLWYAVRRSCAPRLLTIQPIDGRPQLFAVNDTDDSWTGSIRARRVQFDGSVKSSVEVPFAVGPRASVMILRLTEALGPAIDPSTECIVADVIGETSHRATWFFERDKNLKMPAPRLRAKCRAHGDSVHVEIEAITLLRDLVFSADRVCPNASVSDQLITLLPGESATIVVTSKSRSPNDLAASQQKLLSPQTLRCINGPVQIERF